MTVTGIAVNDEYLYVALRDPAAGIALTGDRYVGALVVLKKTDLSMVSVTELDFKTGQISIHNNLMMLNMQMAGWDLYNIEDASNPVLLHSYRADIGSVEYQGGDWLEHDSRLYYIGGGFGYGVYIWDCTDTPNPKLVSNFKLASQGIVAHTYDVYCEYPYVYTTIASPKSLYGTNGDIRGLLVLNISDLSNITYQILSLPNDIITDSITIGDGSPVHLAASDDYIFLNTGETGVAMIRKNGFNSKYVNQLECGGKNGWVFNVKVAEDGRVIVADAVNNCTKSSIYVYKEVESMDVTKEYIISVRAAYDDDEMPISKWSKSIILDLADTPKMLYRSTK